MGLGAFTPTPILFFLLQPLINKNTLLSTLANNFAEFFFFTSKRPADRLYILLSNFN